MNEIGFTIQLQHQTESRRSSSLYLALKRIPKKPLEQERRQVLWKEIKGAQKRRKVLGKWWEGEQRGMVYKRDFPSLGCSKHNQPGQL